MEPNVKPLSLQRRNIFFLFLFLVFFSALPIFMFYASGYRYDFFADTPVITATGGLYVNVDTPDATIYLDEQEVLDQRLFRNASYIQGLEPRIHRLHVQASGTATWVKELHVYPHLVTEVEVFNIPVRPHVRPITEYLTRQGEAVLFGTTTPEAFVYVVPVVATTSRATSTLVLNREYAFINDLFLARASTTLIREQLKEQVASFGFATSLPNIDPESTAQATTTIIRNNLKLHERAGEVYVEALGSGRQIPSYFCAALEALNMIPRLDLEATVVQAEDPELPFTTFPLTEAPLTGACRKEILMDRQNQTVHAFYFMPDNTNLVLLHLDDGVYVVEVDDRAWQNSQLLYPGSDLKLLVDGQSIYIKDGDQYLEVFTTIATP